MRDSEAQQLIGQRLRALRLDQFAGNPASFGSLVVVTGGNPKALEIALGLIKHGRRTLPQIVGDLAAARDALFDDLSAHAWLLLDELARRGA
jgi:hypothetical protein